MSGKIKRGVEDLLRRVTGFSTPIFGLEWQGPVSQRETIRHFLTFLEDRRVLFVPYMLEVEEHVSRSVLEIRQRCTETLAELPEDARASGAVRVIRAACRRFLTEPHPDFRNLYGSRDGPDRHGRAAFFTALGELRASVGAQVGLLALIYDLQVEGELASVLPAADDD